MDSKRQAPFSSSFTPNLPALLNQLDCTIVLTTFQAGKVIFISAKNDDQLIQLPRTFHRPMGLALRNDQMAVASHNEVILLRDSPKLAANYKSKSNIYDALYLPRATYYTGPIDIHDMHWGRDGLYAVNTSFSCLCKIDESHSFTPVWQPPFITELIGDDRCHLNGLAMFNDQPLYISSLGTGNHKQSWRQKILSGGTVMHIPTDEMVINGLAMPHSPRVYDEQLYLLLSSQESLVCVDTQKGTYAEVAKIGGFVRGMCRLGDFLFIATSKLRKNSSTYKQLDITEEFNVASVSLLHLPSATIKARLTYHTSVDEIYDIQVLPAVHRPNILNTLTEDHRSAVHLPHQEFWAVPDHEKDF